MFENYSGAVTLTELTRIKYTIDALRKSETVLQEKLANPALEKYYPAILSDLHRHALEILWGLEQLQQRIRTLPESFFDKYQYLEKNGQGIDRIKLLEIHIQHLRHQRYVHIDDACGRRNGTGTGAE